MIPLVLAAIITFQQGAPHCANAVGRLQVATLINADGTVKNAIAIPDAGSERFVGEAEQTALKWQFAATGQEHRRTDPMTFCAEKQP